MSFRTNLQYLRAQRNMTQERLAMLLGVSRQAISKWESEKAYPEMDKLLMICDLFGCTLDDLVLGDVSVSASRPDSHGASAAGRGTTVGGMTGEDAGSPAHAGNAKGSIGDADEPAHLGAAGAIEPSLTGVPTGETPYGTGSPCPAVHANTATLPQDLTGYDEHRRRFALLISGGVAAIFAAVGICNLFDSSNSILGVTRLNDFLTFLCICIGVIAGLAMLVPGGMSYAEFKRRHPYIEDFYTDEDRSRETRLLVVGIVGGIAAILIGIALTVYADDVLGISDGWPNAIMLMLYSVAVFSFVYCGIRHGMLDIDGYNKKADTDGKKERAAGHDFYDNLTGAVCGIIMSLAMITALCLLFLGPWMLHDDWSFVGSGPFWLPWPIGGVLCGIASLIIQLVKDYRRRNDDGQGAGQPGRTK